MGLSFDQEIPLAASNSSPTFPGGQMHRLVVLPFLFAAVSLSQTQLSYAKIDFLGAVATEARGINNFGEIAASIKR